MRKAILHLKKCDPVLAGIIERVGPCRIQFRDADFQTLVRSIVYQQLSGKVAAVIMGRLVARMAKQSVTPRAILKLPVEELRAVGLSKQKAAYIRDLAEKTASGALDFPSLADLSDDEVIERLTQVKGIGVWTAHMFLIFALQRPNILPVGDLGVRSAVKKAYALDDLPRPDELARIAKGWHPYCSIASWYLWRSLEGPAAV
jgi:DNA-3-methyladenine glycosylase II